jgi:hypothetical protein
LGGENGPRSPYFEEKPSEFSIFRLYIPVDRQTKGGNPNFFPLPSLTCSQIWLSLLVYDHYNKTSQNGGKTNVGQVPSFYENRWGVWDCFERPDLVLFFFFNFTFSRPGQGFKKFAKKKNSTCVSKC